MFKLSISSTVWRFYLMMLVAIVAVYTQQSWLILLAFAVGVSAILGYQISWQPAKQKGKVIALKQTAERKQKKAV